MPFLPQCFTFATLAVLPLAVAPAIGKTTQLGKRVLSGQLASRLYFLWQIPSEPALGGPS